MLRCFNQIPVFRTREKWGRIGRVKERKERGKRREVNKVSCSLPVRALWRVVHIRRRQGQKGPSWGYHWVWSIGRQAGPEYPEWSWCQLQWRRVPARVTICCRKGDPFQGLKLDSCLTLRNELSEKTHVLTKQEILLGKGTWVESRRVREPRRTALPHGLQSQVLWWWDQFPCCL